MTRISKPEPNELNAKPPGEQKPGVLGALAVKKPIKIWRSWRLGGKESKISGSERLRQFLLENHTRRVSKLEGRIGRLNEVPHGI